jgi:phosphoribosylamine--glycine ligase
MKILVIGSGGREHALVWKIAQSPLVKKVYCAPGNPGIGQLAENVAMKVDDLQGLLAFAQQQKIDLTVVGPELPLSLESSTCSRNMALKVFGQEECRFIEASKAFAKDLMKKYDVPTAAYEVFTEVEPALAFIDKIGIPIVIKADGLAAGKGVVIAETRDQAVATILDMLSGKTFGSAGARIVIEEFLRGEEASFLAFTDGKNIIPWRAHRITRRSLTMTGDPIPAAYLLLPQW